MKTGKVHQAVLAIARRLDRANIPYAIAGAMALGAHGYERVTVDVDVLLTREGLARFKREELGRGYAENFPGNKGLRDTEHGVSIGVLIAGEFGRRSSEASGLSRSRRGGDRRGAVSHSDAAEARRAEARVWHDGTPSPQGSGGRSRARSRREAAGGTGREPESVCS